MFQFTPYLLKVLWRHRARTLLTLSGAAVAVFVFCFVGSVQEGMSGLQRRQAGERTLIAFQANKFCPATSHLPEDYSEQIEELPGVRQVVPIQVYTNNCRASLDVVVFYGLPPHLLRACRDFRLIEGDWAEFDDVNHQGAAIVGRSVAKRRKEVAVGQPFTVGSTTVNVVGIYESDDPAEENYIYTHLDFLQRKNAGNLDGTVTQIEVLLDSEADATATCETIDTMLRSGPTEVTTQPKGAFQSQALNDLEQLIGMSHYLAIACVGLMLALVATTTVMSVEDRIKEHAILQTIGFSGLRVFWLIVTESTILSSIGGAIGVITSMTVLQVRQLSVGAEAVSVPFTPSISLATVGLLVGVGTGIVAGIAPAIHAARTQIVPALRQA